jgi:hypothetical protein
LRPRFEEVSVTIALVALSAVAAYYLYRALLAGHSGWNLSSWFVFGTAWVVNAAITVGKITHQVVLTTAPDGTTAAQFSGWTNSILVVHGVQLTGLLAAFSLIGTLVRGHVRVNLAGVLAALIGIMGIFGAGLTGGPFANRLVGAALLLIITAAVLEPGRGAWLGAAAFTVSFCLVSAAATLVNYAATIAPCGRKCGALGVIYRGAAIHENALGLVLALGLPFVLISFHGRARLFLALYVLAITLVTGSRTAIVTVALTLAVAILSGIRTEPAGGVGGRRRAVLLGAVVLAGVTSILLPLVVRDPLAFTSRGYLWQLAMHQLQRSPVPGLGWNAWDTLVANGVVNKASSYSAHNQWIDTAVLAGAVGVVLLALFLAVVLLGGGPEGLWPSGLVLFAVLVVGTVERPLAFDTIDWLSWVITAVILTTPRRMSPSASASRARRVGTARSAGRRAAANVSPST